MITPVFRLSQDDKFLIVTIRAPYSNLTASEVAYEERTFLFTARPYFLRLFLPAEVIDDGTGTCEYAAEEGIFTISVPKKCHGQYFQRLDMLSELLRPQQPSAHRLVEDLGRPVACDKLKEKENDDDTESDNEAAEAEYEQLCSDDALYAQQTLTTSEEGEIKKKNDDESHESANEVQQFGYGFGWLRNGVFGRLFCDEIDGLIDLEDPEGTPISERNEKLRKFDETSFGEQHYLADLFESDAGLQQALKFRFDPAVHLKLSDEDYADLKDLKRRQLENFSGDKMRKIAYSLVDILYAFLYDLRTTDADATPESSWTIVKLAPTFSFLTCWESVFDSLVASVRRSICFPLYRNWSLSIQILEDLKMAVQSGRSSILHALLSIRRMFNRGGEFRYLFNQLFVDDLCLWIQSVPDRCIEELSAALNEAVPRITKDSVGLDLNCFELAARLQMQTIVENNGSEDANKGAGQFDRDKIYDTHQKSINSTDAEEFDSDDEII